MAAVDWQRLSEKMKKEDDERGNAFYIFFM
jgi:hypothetical protein